jgi:myo-inositol-1(or 4)-monophosphatase
MLLELERTAVELARLAGAEIVSTLGRTLAVKYKSLGSGIAYQDPVSEVDRHVEELIRARLAERFPDHDVLGEELEEHRGPDGDFVWAVDPVDGTANFVNGFPLFAASIGVLHRGLPVAGAVWCSSTHALRPGVYHAHAGGRLRFDEESLDRPANPEVRRRLVGLPHLADAAGLPYDARKTGSAAIECAYVAAGLLAAARFERPNAWDVAGGLVLVKAVGFEALVGGGEGGGWAPFSRFEGPAGPPSGGVDLGSWRRPILIGEPEAVRALARDGGAT